MKTATVNPPPAAAATAAAAAGKVNVLPASSVRKKTKGLQSIAMATGKACGTSKADKSTASRNEADTQTKKELEGKGETNESLTYMDESKTAAKGKRGPIRGKQGDDDSKVATTEEHTTVTPMDLSTVLDVNNLAKTPPASDSSGKEKNSKNLKGDANRNAIDRTGPGANNRQAKEGDLEDALDVEKLLKMMRGCADAGDKIDGTMTLLLFGGPRVGKTTTALYLAGATFENVEADGLDHFNPTNVLDPGLAKFIVAGGPESTTDTIQATRVTLPDGRQVTICDTPSFAWSDGVEEISINVGVMRALRRASGIKPVWVLNSQTMRANGYQEIRETLEVVRGVMGKTPDFSPFEYVFTGCDHRRVTRIHKELAALLCAADDADEVWKMLLSDMILKTTPGATLINPVEVDKVPGILETLTSRDEGGLEKHSQFFREFLSERACSTLKLQVSRMLKRMSKACDGADYGVAKSVLEQLSGLSAMIPMADIEQALLQAKCSVERVKQHIRYAVMDLMKKAPQVTKDGEYLDIVSSLREKFLALTNLQCVFLRRLADDVIKTLSRKNQDLLPLDDARKGRKNLQRALRRQCYLVDTLQGLASTNHFKEKSDLVVRRASQIIDREVSAVVKALDGHVSQAKTVDRMQTSIFFIFDTIFFSRSLKFPVVLGSDGYRCVSLEMVARKVLNRLAQDIKCKTEDMERMIEDSNEVSHGTSSDSRCWVTVEVGFSILRGIKPFIADEQQALLDLVQRLKEVTFKYTLVKFERYKKLVDTLQEHRPYDIGAIEATLHNISYISKFATAIHKADPDIFGDELPRSDDTRAALERLNEKASEEGSEAACANSPRRDEQSLQGSVEGAKRKSSDISVNNTTEKTSVSASDSEKPPLFSAKKAAPNTVGQSEDATVEVESGYAHAQRDARSLDSKKRKSADLNEEDRNQRKMPARVSKKARKSRVRPVVVGMEAENEKTSPARQRVDDFDDKTYLCNIPVRPDKSLCSSPSLASDSPLTPARKVQSSSVSSALNEMPASNATAESSVTPSPRQGGTPMRSSNKPAESRTQNGSKLTAIEKDDIITMDGGVAWYRRYKECRNFQKKHGHGSPSRKHPDAQHNERWLEEQRHKWRKGELPYPCKTALAKLGFALSVEEKRIPACKDWDRRFEELGKTIKTRKSGFPRHSSELGKWYRTQIYFLEVWKLTGEYPTADKSLAQRRYAKMNSIKAFDGDARRRAVPHSTKAGAGS